MSQFRRSPFATVEGVRPDIGPAASQRPTSLMILRITMGNRFPCFANCALKAAAGGLYPALQPLTEALRSVVCRALPNSARGAQRQWIVRRGLSPKNIAAGKAAVVLTARHQEAQNRRIRSRGEAADFSCIFSASAPGPNSLLNYATYYEEDHICSRLSHTDHSSHMR
jgi:hypothetical protein